MKKTANKVTAICIALLLLSLPAVLSARERRGAIIVVTLKDGQTVWGELIAVKPESILLLNAAGKDQSVDLVGIASIRVVKQSKAWQGAKFGCLAGLVGTLIYASTQKGGLNQAGAAVGGFMAFVPGGAVIGVLAGAMAGKDKQIQLEGKSESEVRQALAYLLSKARIHDYK